MLMPHMLTDHKRGQDMRSEVEAWVQVLALPVPSNVALAVSHVPFWGLRTLTFKGRDMFCMGGVIIPTSQDAFDDKSKVM